MDADQAVTCPRCAGHGSWWDDADEDVAGDGIEVVCPLCSGDGRVGAERLAAALRDAWAQRDAAYDGARDAYRQAADSAAILDAEREYVARHALVDALRNAPNREPYIRMLREALRAEVGPSIDDVREVWGDPRMVTKWCGAGIGHKCSWSVRAGGTVPWVPSDTFGDTEREALQAAYDAGVARKGGD